MGMKSIDRTILFPAFWSWTLFDFVFRPRLKRLSVILFTILTKLLIELPLSSVELE